MPTPSSSATAREARTLPFRSIVPRLVRDPIKALGDIGTEADGEIVRLNLGTFRPLLVTHPDHVQHVLRGNVANYARDGVFWRPLRRLFGGSVLSDGEIWEVSRATLQPLFAAKHVESLAGAMAETVADAVAALGETAGQERPVDAAAELARIVNKTVIRLFFGDRITPEESERLIPAHDAIATSIVSRLLLPLVPESVPLPGDRAFREAVRTFDSVMVPLVHGYTPSPGDGRDVFSLLCRTRDAQAGSLPPSWVRDNMVAMFAAGTETTVVALTWLWPILDRHPHVEARLREEIGRVVGGERVRPDHLPGLVYTRMVIQELLRLYPVGWMLPRVVVEPETLGGVRLRAGETVLISPFLTHRLPSVWDRPLEFDPERFAPGRGEHRHRYAYFPFGGGPHQCMGTHVFNMEAQFIVAAMLSAFRPALAAPVPPTPRAAASLRPRQSVIMTLRPAAHATAHGAS
ncbi:cytochrome P450 [Thermocatellispora tengchongensis]|uniref:Cytochrome P450 n=1 Tax=Thermocatellispora tengchongensis TaxID=1073253 RepID=A0A840P5A2_9ACTN|nr:cytochrome P450 [Thermocatellispora tengchongensis]MBB5136484.1 cytochrome P450 [Thermocatellispora tengchongensis]